MNGMNEKAPESHECERKLRLQRQREQRRARLARETKEQRQRRLQLRREETDVVSKVVGLKKQARKHRSDSKPSASEMAAYVSAKQPNKGLAGYWIKAKVMLAAMKMKRQQRRNQRYKTEYLHNQQLRLQRRCGQR